jgi:hypothetical protein
VKGAVKGAAKKVEKPKRDVAPKSQKGGKVIKPALQKALKAQKKASSYTWHVSCTRGDPKVTGTDLLRMRAF